MKLQYFEDISLTPFRKELQGYSLQSLFRDFSAAVSVALLTLPQAMAFAFMAGLPLSTSLFAVIFSCLIAAVFGSSRFLILGPSNAIIILILVGTSEILYQHFRQLTGVYRELMAFQIMTQMTFLAAIMQLLAAGLKLGHLTQFVSYSVVLGYILGTASAVIISQLYVIFGIPPLEGVQSLSSKLFYFIAHIHEVHWVTLVIGAGSVVLVYALKKWNRRIPGALIALCAATTAVYFGAKYWGGDLQDVQLIGDSGEITTVMPQIVFPSMNFQILNNLLPVSFAITLLSILETSAVAKSIAAHTGQRFSINQEILGLGLGNLTSAFLGAMPISGSTSRTFMNYESGAQTRIAAILACIVIGFIMSAFGDLVSRIPLATLSALLIVTVAGVVKKKQILLCLKTTKSDSLVFLVTFLSCIFIGIDVAFYIGVAISITLYLKKASIPQVLQYIVDASGRIKNLDFCTEEEHTPVRFIKVKGELFFGAADLFQTTLKSIAEDDNKTRVIILQLKNARDMDATACFALQQLFDYLRSAGRHLIISGITLPIWEAMSGSGLVKTIGKENMFLIDERNPNLYFQRAIKRAGDLLEEKKVEQVQVSAQTLSSLQPAAAEVSP